MQMSYERDEFAGMILAGGLSRRMGENKGKMLLGGERLLDRVFFAVEYSVSDICINGSLDEWSEERASGREVIEDVIEGGEGPLVGILSGLIWAGKKQKTWLFTSPVDTPFLTSDIVRLMIDTASLSGKSMVCARSRGRHHPVIGCWHVSLRESMSLAIESGVRKIDKFVEDFVGADERVFVDFDEKDRDILMNVNSREDMIKAREIIEG